MDLWGMTGREVVGELVSMGSSWESSALGERSLVFWEVQGNKVSVIGRFRESLELKETEQ